MGLVRGKANPCAFRDPERDIDTVVHGDDYFSCGLEESLRWMQRGLEKVFVRKTKLIGRPPGIPKRLVVFGRTVRFDDQCIACKVDPQERRATNR